MGRNRTAYNNYQRQYQLDRYYRRRQEAVAFLGDACVQCGTADDLEVDHIDPASKSFPVSRMWSVSEERFWVEVKKCQVLCKPHHLEKTREENSVPHGGGVSGKKNCPCVPCKQRKAEYMASYRQMIAVP